MWTARFVLPERGAARHEGPELVLARAAAVIVLAVAVPARDANWPSLGVGGITVC